MRHRLTAEIAVVGAGLIGASWASLFLAYGFDIAVTDPAPRAEMFLRRFITDAWPALVELVGAPSEIPACSFSHA